MRCPACERPLKAVVIRGVEVDVCQGGCEGIWLDRFELSDKLEGIRAFNEYKNMELDLMQAREIQRHLLPCDIPQVPGFSVQHVSRPTRQVGGDFYDFLTLDSGELVGVLADVSGKGVSSALLASLVQGALQMEFNSSKECDAVLKSLNTLLCRKLQTGRFVTMFAVALDGSGQGHYASAGHNPAYVYRAYRNELEELTSSGLIAGAFEFAQFSRHALSLHKGDILVVYSDGVTEADGPNGETFGEDRLRQLILGEASAGSEVLKLKLLDAVETFTEGCHRTMT